MVWNLIYRFISIISRASLILGMIEQFSTESWPLNLEKYQLFAVYVHFLRGCFQGRGAYMFTNISFFFYTFGCQKVLPICQLLIWQRVGNLLEPLHTGNLLSKNFKLNILIKLHFENVKSTMYFPFNYTELFNSLNHTWGNIFLTLCSGKNSSLWETI